MDKRFFGLEIECATPGDNGAHWTENLLEAEGYGDWADVGYDGTEIEIHSPPLSGASGFKELKGVLALLNKEGFYTTGEDGLHIHHHAPEFVGNPELTARLVESWVNNEKYIHDLVDSRRHNGWACPRTSPSKAYRIRHGESLGGRDDLNVGPINRLPDPTIEFRLHEGTLDYDSAEAWIKFGQYLIKGVIKRKKPLDCASDPNIFLNRLRVSPNARKNLRPFRAVA